MTLVDKAKMDGGGPEEAADYDAFKRHYESSMYKPIIREYTNFSDFHNYGYWEEDTKTIEDAQRNLMKRLLSHLPRMNGEVLDVACGKGATTRYLLKHFSPENITAIDVGEKQLETARANAPGCEFLRADAAELDFPDESFDTILSVEAAFHFNTREKFMRRALRVLKPGGCLLMTDVLMTYEAEKRRAGRNVKNYLKDPGAYRALLRTIGFDRFEVIDATEQCWRRYSWDAINFAHRKLLNGEISLPELQELLSPLYGRVPDLRYYVIVVAHRD